MAFRCEAGRSHQAGKIADRLGQTTLQVAQHDSQRSTSVDDIDQLLGNRAETRRKHRLRAVSQIFQVAAILIHHGQARHGRLDVIALLDKSDARVEITRGARQFGVHGVTGDVGETPPMLLRGIVLRADALRARGHIPQAEGKADPAARRGGNLCHEQHGRVGRAPVSEARHGAETDTLLRERGLLQRNESL